MKLQDVIVCLKGHRGKLTPDQQERLEEVSARMFDFWFAKEAVHTDQQELVDQLIRDLDDLAYEVYGLAAAVESR